MAYNLEAPWIALFVDTGFTLTQNDENNLKKIKNKYKEVEKKFGKIF